MRRLPLLLALLLPLVLVGNASAQTGPQIAFDASSVTASGLTPGQAVVWFGVEHAVDSEYSGEMTPHYSAATAAADGTARLDLGRAPAPRSYWVAVDLSSGAFAVAAPAGYPITRAKRPSRAGLGEGNQPDELVDDRAFLMGLVVRPGVGAWAFSGGDGGPRDEDGKNDGHLRFALDKFDPLPGSPAAPAKINGQDLWFVVDPLAMEIAVHKGGVAQ